MLQEEENVKFENRSCHCFEERKFSEGTSFLKFEFNEKHASQVMLYNPLCKFR